MKKQIVLALISIIFISLLIVFILISEPGRSGDRHGPPGRGFVQSFDDDRDGTVTRGEWDGHVGSAFDGNDRDKDGFVKKADITENRHTGLPKGDNPFDTPPPFVLVKMDADRDGKVSRKEWIGFHGEFFVRMDNNKNGIIDAGELNAPPFMMDKEGPGPGGPGQGNDKGGFPPPPPM